MNFASFITHFLLGCLIIFAGGEAGGALIKHIRVTHLLIYMLQIFFDVLFIKLGALAKLEQQRENFFMLG